MHAVQPSFDDLGVPLSDVTFVVVDLETTGATSDASHITEIGAVKVQGGEVLGEFATLVDPGEPIPAFIAVLTGITDAMVMGAPRIDAALPSFFEFARGCVLVAHNAPFDVGFLKAAAARLGLDWPGFPVVDTVRLARLLVSSDEARDHKLATLAHLFGADTTPDHRALHDARATVDVLHALLGRVGGSGVRTLDDLTTYTSRVTPTQRRKRHLADGLPHAPGVYVFRDDADRPLYVGTSVDIARRVRTYFTAAERRTRMSEMIRLAHRVTPIVCETRLEAQVREVRLIAEYEPRYNRRSRRPHRRPWIKLTRETFPRLSVVRSVRADGATYAGPFRTTDAARAALAALHDAVPLRQCTLRLSSRTRVNPCALAEMGRCGAPCNGRQGAEEYALLADRVEALLTGRSRDVIDILSARLAELTTTQRYEDAAVLRDRVRHLVRAAHRTQRVRSLAVISELVAARRRPAGGWEIVCVRHGRLAGASTTPAGADPMPYVEAVVASAESVPAPVLPAPAALAEETDLVLDWLEQDGTRLVSLDHGWASPAHGVGALTHFLAPVPFTAAPFAADDTRPRRDKRPFGGAVGRRSDVVRAGGTPEQAGTVAGHDPGNGSGVAGRIGA